MFTREKNVTAQIMETYRFQSEIKIYSHQQLVSEFKRLLRNLEDGEIVRFVSGEAHSELFNACGRELRDARAQKGVRYEMIAGPVLSCSGSNACRNVVRDLAAEGILRLYLSRIRPKLHMTIIGDRLLRGELPHDPASSLDGRRGYKIDVRRVAKVRKEHARWAIENRIREFEELKPFCERVNRKGATRVPMLDIETIEAVANRAHEEGKDFDSLTRQQILSLAKGLEPAGSIT